MSLTASTIPAEAISAIGAVSAALIAALISLLGLIISKEHKVSEFRQAWNDGLREDVALIVSHLECLRGVAHASLPNKAPWADKKDHFIAINRAIVAVRLRLEAGPQSEELLSKLEALETAAQAGDIGTSALLGPAVNEFIDASRGVIRQEWSLIRRGEGVYLWTRYASVSIIVFAVLALAVLVPMWMSRASADNENATDKNRNTASAGAASEVKVLVFTCGPALGKRSTRTLDGSTTAQYSAEPCVMSDAKNVRK